MIPFKKITIVFTISIFVGLLTYAAILTKSKIKVQPSNTDPNTTTEEVIKKTMILKSSAFENNGYIPQKYTCDGENINPPLEIDDVFENAISLVIIVDDPDAPSGNWVHWLIWNIDAKENSIDEGTVPNSAIQGVNDFNENSYGGPCPPSGTHRYQFKLYALDTKLDLNPKSKRNDLENAMSSHIIDQSLLIGLYERK